MRRYIYRQQKKRGHEERGGVFQKFADERQRAVRGEQGEKGLGGGRTRVELFGNEEQYRVGKEDQRVYDGENQRGKRGGGSS